MDADILNLNQQPEELTKVHATDYYWYLRSKPFIETFISRIGMVVNILGDSVLDVACGEGYLAGECDVRYAGFDGSDEAIRKARESHPDKQFEVGRLESPDFGLGQFDAVVFGGVFSVLVKPERHAEFVAEYCKGYGAKWVIIYDLERLDMSPFDGHFQKVTSWSGNVDMHAEIGDVRTDRKIAVYNVSGGTLDDGTVAILNGIIS